MVIKFWWNELILTTNRMLMIWWYISPFIEVTFTSGCVTSEVTVTNDTTKPSKSLRVGEWTAMWVAMISRCAVVCSVMICPWVRKLGELKSECSSWKGGELLLEGSVDVLLMRQWLLVFAELHSYAIRCSNQFCSPKPKFCWLKAYFYFIF